MLDKHILWMNRKFEQAEQSRYNARYTRQRDEANALIYLELLKSEDKKARDEAIHYLLPSYEEAKKREREGDSGNAKGKQSEEFADPRVAFAALYERLQAQASSEDDD